MLSKILLVALLVLVSFSFPACVTTGTSRFIDKPETLMVETGMPESQDENLKITLSHVIVPNAPGSWVKDARWDEYILVVNNVSDKPITILNVRLVDSKGLYIEKGQSPSQLRRDSGSMMSAGTAMGGAVAVSAASVAGRQVIAAIPGVGLLAGIGAASLGSNRTKEFIEDQKIAVELAKRQIKPFTLASKGECTVSVFFPTVPAPKALVVDYKSQAETKIIELSLNKLNLHVSPQKTAQTQQ